jgi:hypothetical protein
LCSRPPASRANAGGGATGSASEPFAGWAAIPPRLNRGRMEMFLSKGLFR